jgi:hypothetical protein
LIRSADGGATFQVVFGEPNATIGSAFAANGQTDVACSPTGKVFLAFSGSNPVMALRGIWRSENGNVNSWSRLAGGNILGVDSADGWRGNAYNFDLVGT